MTSEGSSLQRIGAQTDGVQRMVAGIQLMVTLAGLLASVLVPIARRVPDHGDHPTTRYGWDSLVGIVFSDLDPRYFGGTGAHPFAVPGGLLVTKIALIVLLVAVIASFLLCWALLDPPVHRAYHILTVVAAILLLLSGVAVTAGLAWLPEYRDEPFGPAWGCWVPIWCAGWILIGLRGAQRLEPPGRTM